MNLESVKNKEKKRVGRGLSAGQGKTSGRGTKGQKSRAGFNIPSRFEGGQTPLSMRLPKLPGFKSSKKKATIISLDQISENFKDGEVITKEALVTKGLATISSKVKVLANGKLNVKVSLGEDVKTSEATKDLFVQEKTETAKTATAKKTTQEKSE